MKKAYKCALRISQIEKMLQLLDGNDNLVEIQLLSTADDLSAIDCFRDRIGSIHLPIEKEERTCNISTIIKACEEKRDKYIFLCRVAAYATRENCGIVAHADISAEEMTKLSGYREFINWLNLYGVSLYLENTPEIQNARKSILAPLCISYTINNSLIDKTVRPLLDICHFQISYNQYNSNLKHNLAEIVDLYSNDRMIIHFNTAIGNGDNNNGGVHGGNFSENPELLEALLKDLKKFNPILVLEVKDEDLINKPNEVALNNKIDEILKKFNKSDIEKIKEDM